jgi:hypothetical protein
MSRMGGLSPRTGPRLLGAQWQAKTRAGFGCEVWAAAAPRRGPRSAGSSPPGYEIELIWVPALVWDGFVLPTHGTGSTSKDERSLCSVSAPSIANVEFTVSSPSRSLRRSAWRRVAHPSRRCIDRCVVPAGEVVRTTADHSRGLARPTRTSRSPATPEAVGRGFRRMPKRWAARLHRTGNRQLGYCGATDLQRIEPHSSWMLGRRARSSGRRAWWVYTFSDAPADRSPPH